MTQTTLPTTTTTQTMESSSSCVLPDDYANLILVGADNITGIGNAYDNRIIGNLGQNTLAGGAGNDVIETGGGADQVDGGTGVDTVLLPDLDGGYNLAWIAGGAALTARANIHEYVTVKNAEHIQAGRLHVAWANEGHADQVYGLYQAAFYRKPDVEGMGFWLNKYDEGTSLTAIAAEFMKSEEFNRRFPGVADDTADLVTMMYHHVLHREPDAEGYAYWKGVMDAHLIDSAQLLVYFAGSEENQVNIVGSMAQGYAYLLPA